jgi:hypothetical protein
MTAHAHHLARSRVAAGALLAVIMMWAVFVSPPRSLASTIPLTLSERAAVASAVFVARVGNDSASAQGRGISTHYELTDTQVLKGDAPRTLKLRGGRIGSHQQWVSDQPQLRRGATYLFFLDRQGRTIGGPQGAVEVQDGKLSGTTVTLDRVADAVALMTLPPQQSRAFPELRSLKPGSAALAEIESAIGAAGATTPGADPAAAGTDGTAGSAPAITAITPDEVAAGTGTIVELDGVGFGTATGTVDVTYVNGHSAFRAPISRWTDTRITFGVPVFVASGYPAAPGSGSVRVTPAVGGGAAYTTLRVTYAFDGDFWENTPVKVSFNPAGAAPGALTMLQGAISTWSAAGFDLVYAGPSTATPSTLFGDDRNDVVWSTRLDAYTLAATSWYTLDGVHVKEQAIEFNSSALWGDGTGSTFDIQSVALHELGHWVVLRDQYGTDSAEVMYGYVSAGQRKRALTQAELDGVRYAYGADRAAPSTPVSLTSSASFTGVWTSGDVTVTITPPGDPNLRSTRYRLDYGPAQSVPVSTELPFVSEGYHDVMVWSSDDAGNNETPTHHTVAIDRTAPTSSSDATSTYGGRAVIRFSGSDLLSGISEYQWRLAGSTTWTIATPAAASATIAEPGTYTLEYRALDLAGNVGETSVVSFEILPLEPAELNLRTASRNVTYGTSLSVEGTLTTGGAELVGQTVKLQASSDGKTWADRAVQPTLAGGRFAFPVRMTSSTYFRVAYEGGLAGGRAYGPVGDPAVIRIGSTAYLSTLVTRRISTRVYDLSVVMLPRHKVGTDVVRLYLWHWEGKWVPHGYVWAKASNVGTSSTKALRRFKFPHTGSWRVQPFHGDANHLATRSPVRTISVR